MNITDIKIRKIFPEGNLAALISITIDDALAVHDIKIVRRGENNVFVAMPSRKDENGIFRDIVHPINATAREALEKLILDEYERYIISAEIEK